jgi:hypothetical protein
MPLNGGAQGDARILAGTGMTAKELKRRAAVLAPLHVPKCRGPSRDRRFGSPAQVVERALGTGGRGGGSGLPDVDRAQRATCRISGSGRQTGAPGRRQVPHPPRARG